jgi:hypothetical protein
MSIHTVYMQYNNMGGTDDKWSKGTMCDRHV